MEGLAHLDERVEDLLRAYGAPGAAVAVTDRTRTLEVRTYGLADVAAGTPVRPEHLFQIGSIGKSFTAAAFMQLVEEGRVDLRVPVATYLPWFEVPSKFEPITVHHLLNHTAGIIEGSDITSDSRFDVWALRELEVAAPPGEHFHYSNVGYRALGFALEEIEGRPYAEIIRDRVLRPAGMAATEPVITNAMRDRQVVAYSEFPDDRPVRYHAPVAPAVWIETGTGDGSVASTAEDMAAYVRVWLNRGQGPRNRVVGEESFELMSSGAAVDAEPGIRYGYGLTARDRNGRLMLGHGGSMIGFASAMFWEPETGFGVVVLTNCIDWQDWAKTLAKDTLGWLDDAQRGLVASLPPPPDLHSVDDAARYAGEYRDADGEVLAVHAQGDRLFVDHSGDRVPLEVRGADRFLIEHRDYDLYYLRFERDDAGIVTSATHGPRIWHRPGPEQPPLSDDGASVYVGHYRSTNPWTPNFRVVAREGAMVLIYSFGAEDPLTPLGEHRFRVGEDDWSPDRLTFDAIAGGQALRANLSGCDYHRAFTP
jgi:D-alanyl-D-alanine carboxypeptidase